MDANGNYHINIKEYYNTCNKTEERKNSFEYFNDKYVKNPFENYWIIEEESRFIARKFNFFLPGSIYAYQYPNPITADYLSYYDKRPMVIIMKTFFAETTKRVIVQGINLNFIPEYQKMELLDTYHNVFRKELIKAEDASDEGLISQAKNIYKFLKDWIFVKKIFVNQGKIPLSFAIRNYHIQGIYNPVFIEIEDWVSIPFYVPKEIEGKFIGQIYADYLVNKNLLK